MQKIRYQEGYKYRLYEQRITKVSIQPETNIVTNFITLSQDGILAIKAGYAWDGASGPTWDDKTNMRGSLVHDALCQLMRLGLLPQSCKEQAHRALQKVMIEDGAFKIRAWYYYKAVSSRFGDKSCSPGYEPYPVLTAP